MDTTPREHAELANMAREMMAESFRNDPALLVDDMDDWEVRDALVSVLNLVFSRHQPGETVQTYPMRVWMEVNDFANKLAEERAIP